MCYSSQFIIYEKFTMFHKKDYNPTSDGKTLEK